MLKNKILTLGKDWNMNFLHKSTNVMELNTSFLKYNLRNTVNVPTRNKKSTSKLLDVIIAMDLGLADHYAHVIHTI